MNQCIQKIRQEHFTVQKKTKGYHKPWLYKMEKVEAVLSLPWKYKILDWQSSIFHTSGIQVYTNIVNVLGVKR